MPEVLIRTECWARFCDAAKDGLRGDYAKAKALIESVHQKHGEEAAQRQRRELWRYMERARKTA
jgi:hypothetical protein